MQKKLVHLISSLKRGGAESLLVDLVAELKQYEHHVVYFHDGPNRKRIEDMGVKTYHIQGLVSLYDPIFFMRLYRLIKNINPSSMHSALWAANVAGRIIACLLKIPLVSVIHLGAHQDGKIRNFIDAATFNLCQQVVVVSQEVADSINTKRWLPAQRVSVITNGISVDRIRALAHHELLTKTALAIPEDAFVIGGDNIPILT